MAAELPAAPGTWAAEVRGLLADLGNGIRGALGRRLLGLYAYGSLVTGDFDLAVSDVDLLAVLDRDLSGPAFLRLDAVHADVVTRHPAWADRVEVAYLGQRALRTFRAARSPMAVISPGEPFHVTDAGRERVTNWFVVHHHGVAMTGPAPSRFIAPIDVAEVVRQLRAEAGSWPGRVPPGSRPGQQAYAVLTACRCLHLAAHGTMTSKTAAAGWARVTLPQWAALIDVAVQMRAVGGWTGEMDRDRTVAFLHAAAELMIGTRPT